MSRDDKAYFTLRAERERALADNCADSSAAIAHRSMADAYARRAIQAEEDERRLVQTLRDLPGPVLPFTGAKPV